MEIRLVPRCQWDHQSCCLLLVHPLNEGHVVSSGCGKYKYKYKYVQLQVCVCLCVRPCVCACACVCICTCVSMHIRMHTTIYKSCFLFIFSTGDQPSFCFHFPIGAWVAIAFIVFFLCIVIPVASSICCCVCACLGVACFSNKSPNYNQL